MDTYLYEVNWYGPFNSQKQLNKWEDENQEYDCNLYLIRGYQYRDRKPTVYCGKAVRQTVAQRFTNGNHIHELKNRTSEMEIWVGKISYWANVGSDVSICENMLISVLNNGFNGSFKVANSKSFYTPNVSVCMVNEWYDKDDWSLVRKRFSSHSPAKLIPDVIVYDSEEGTLHSAMNLSHPICMKCQRR